MRQKDTSGHAPAQDRNSVLGAGLSVRNEVLSGQHYHELCLEGICFGKVFLPGKISLHKSLWYINGHPAVTRVTCLPLLLKFKFNSACLHVHKHPYT